MMMVPLHGGRMALAPLLANLKICCTGLEEDIRAAIQKKTEALGGRYSLHLTKDCTHLIAGSVLKSSKYKSALQYGIPVVTVNWIDECWNSAHLNSGPIEEQRRFLYQMAMTKYSVGGLQGCLVSVTGVAFEERAKICSMVQELGGTYSPDLNPQCSHLIFEDLDIITDKEGTLSQQNAALSVKVTYALRWSIPVVSKEWIYACYSQKMLLEESDYSVNPGNYNEESSSQAAEILPVKLGDIREDTPSFLHGCHIYLNGESISSQKLAVLKRLVLAAGGARYTDLDTMNLTHIVIHNQLLPNNLKMFLDQQQQDEVKLVHDNWLFDSFREGRRLLEDDYEVIKKPNLNSKPNTRTDSSQQQQNVPQKWKSAFASNPNPNSSITNASMNHQNNNTSFLNANPNISYGTPRTSVAGKEDFLARTPNVLESSAKTLKGKSVYLGALSSGSKIQKLIMKARRAGMTVVEDEIEADWCITGVLITQESFRKLTLHRSPTDLRNEIWFEAALDSKSHAPSMSFAHPVPCSSFPLSNLSKLIISQSGFTGAEREFYTEMIKASGAQYTDSLSKTNTHLVIKEPRSGAKYDFAKKWKIECIDLDWFRSVLESKSVKNIRDFSNSNESVSVVYNNTNNSNAKLSFQSVKPVENVILKGEDKDKSDGLLFKGLIFAGSQRLWHRRDELSDLVESLGGVFLSSLDRTCTHYLHQGKLAEEAFKEFKQARQWGKYIVSPWWVVKCKEMGRRLDELQFQHTYKEVVYNNENEDSNKEYRKDDEKENNDHDLTKSNNDQSQSQSQLQSQIPKSQSQSQSELNWNDIMAERRAEAFILKPGSKIFNIEDHPAFQTVTTGSTPAADAPLKPVKVQYRIVFSGWTSGERTEMVKLINSSSRKDYFKIIAEDELIQWDPKTTILICNSLNFTEKIFSACATGCWILKREFLNESESQSLINFEKYEMGPAWNANERDMIIGRAPKYWRQRLSTGSNELRPFHGWKCALMMESARQVLYESVLRNGGAQIYQVDQLKSSQQSLIKEMTHFFCVNLKSIPEEVRKYMRTEQVFPTKHITNTIFRLND